MTAFLDTNVLIYAQSTGAKGDIARDAMLAGGVISVQVLNEFAAVLRRKFRQDWPDIAAAVTDVRAALDLVRPIGVDTHQAAVALAQDNGLGFYDALIVAAALHARCDLLLTEDLQTGRRIGGLAIVNPFAQIVSPAPRWSRPPRPSTSG